MAQPAPIRREEPVLNIQNLWKAYDGSQALQGLFLAAYPGEIFGLIGPNGAGKPTTIRILVGLLRPDAGEVRLLGEDTLRDPIGYKARPGSMPHAPELQADPPPHSALG